MKKKTLGIAALTLCLSLYGCSSNEAAMEDVQTQENETTETAQVTETSSLITKDDITVNETYENSEDGGHAIEVSGEEASYSNVAVNKTGDSSGDEADFYGENAAIYAHDGATLTLSEIVVETDGTHANGVFSYGEGTTINISDSVIETSGNCSGGLMTTGGAAMNAENLNIHTTGNSSAAIRSDRGGGTVNVTGGSYITDGEGSPVIYSTADITVSDAYLESTSSQGVVVEGQNSVTLNDLELVAENDSKNSDKSDYYQAVMIYQSMSGDADEGLASFTMNGGSLLNKNGDIFFVNNTVAAISLSDVTITNEDADGVFLRAEATGWGNEGSNGGHVTLNASKQTIGGDILVDEISSLNLYLSDSSLFTGSINPDGEEGEVYVELDEGSTWVLSEDSYITSLTCDADSIDLNGHKLYVNGVEYSAGEVMEGEAIEVTVSSSSSMPDMPSDGGHGPGQGGTPPEKPGDHND